MADRPVATFSAPTYVLPHNTQSPNADKPMTSPSNTSTDSAPAPTVMTQTPSATATSPSTSAPSSSSSSTSSTSPAASSIGTLSASSIGLNQPVVPISASGGNITPEHNKLSWYSSSVKPGQSGTMIVIGYRSDTLAKASGLKTGSQIKIGSTTYTVKSQHTDTMSGLHSDTGLWGATTAKQLALVVIDGSNAQIIMAAAS